MAWFSLRRRAKPKRLQRFEQADPVVVNVFARLQQYLKCSQFPDIRALQRFEREAWDRLIDYLIKLPPLPADD